MKRSTIYLTRRGFSYQDRVALLVFLDHFQTKDISAFYVDYPLTEQKSLDIRLLLVGDKEEIYEVKSGQYFKMDKRKKETSEISEAIINLYKYLKINKGASAHLVVSKGFQPQIAEYWGKLLYAQNSSMNSPPTQKAVKWLHKKLGPKNSVLFNSLHDLHSFCLSLDIVEFPDDQCNTSLIDKYPPIDDDIIQKINDLLKIAGAHACHFELDEDNLLHRLLSICNDNAGKSNDIFPLLKSEILSFISQRKYLDENYSAKDSKQPTKEKIEEQVDKWFESWWNPKLIQKGNQSLSKGTI